MLEAWLISLETGSYLRAVLIFIVVALAVVTICHAVIYKKDSRAAVGWSAFIFAAPIVGTLGYFFFGLNRIQRKGLKFSLNSSKVFNESAPLGHLAPILKTGEALSYSPVGSVESIIPLNTGDQAYPAMLKAIEEATKTVFLFSYIFEVDKAGEQFVEAVIKAHKRGVRVKVLVDGLGSKATLGTLKTRLAKAGVSHAVFLPVLWRPRFANLRNHRKILVVDGRIAFTGGLNVAEVYWPEISGDKAVLDFHFRLEGEIVGFIEAVFVDDWFFATKEKLEIEKGLAESDTPEAEPKGLGRVVIGGPGENIEKMQWHFVSAINNAQESIKIITPYFLPSQAVESALIGASLRGVNVEVIMPEETDHVVVTWAMQASLAELLKYKVKFFFSGPKFDHSKLFLVDDNYTSLGSSNWDVRSFRLNFEMNVELVSKELNKSLTEIFESKKREESQYSLEEYEASSLLKKLRGGFCRMLSPYL